jgi:ferredoxin-NADP reductase
VLIGGGVGITPIRALLDEFKDSASVDVLFRAPREEDLILREELDYIASKSHGTVRVHYMAGPRKNFPMDAPFLGALIPDIADSEIYICGPLALIETVVQAAKELGVSATRVHHEEFVYHAV